MPDWTPVSIRSREMGTAEHGDPEPGEWRVLPGFYSLSRDGDSGTPRDGLDVADGRVSIRCREMGTAEPREIEAEMTPDQSGFYSLSRDGDSGTGQVCQHPRRHVSIRCREMGTAEHRPGRDERPVHEFLFAVARWGQRNDLRIESDTVADQAFLFAVARWGQRNGQ